MTPVSSVEVAQLQAEIFKATSLRPGRGAPNAMSCMTGHFDITTVGMSTRNMEPLTHMVNGFDSVGRFSHSVVENLVVNIRHRTHGKCGEIEAISWYLLEIERHLNIRINTLEDAVRFTRGTKIQTVELNELGTIAPCTHPDQGGCQILLDALGITYVP